MQTQRTPKPVETFSLRDSLNIMRSHRAEVVAVKKQVSPGILQFLQEDFSNLDNGEFQADQEAIVQAVNAPCTITNSVKDDPKKIELRGVIRFSTDVNFLFTTEQTDGLFIWTAQKGLQLDEEIVQSITKLRAYYDAWYQEKILEIRN